MFLGVKEEGHEGGGLGKVVDGVVGGAGGRNES